MEGCPSARRLPDGMTVPNHTATALADDSAHAHNRAVISHVTAAARRPIGSRCPCRVWGESRHVTSLLPHPGVVEPHGRLPAEPRGFSPRSCPRTRREPSESLVQCSPAPFWLRRRGKRLRPDRWRRSSRRSPPGPRVQAQHYTRRAPRYVVTAAGGGLRALTPRSEDSRVHGSAEAQSPRPRPSGRACLRDRASR